MYLSGFYLQETNVINALSYVRLQDVLVCWLWNQGQSV